MEIRINNSVNFGRLLKPSEEADYASVLERAKAKAGNRGKTILIVPSSSLPQADINNTGVGNLTSNEGFFDFVKKYWGINEIQLLPTGQYHEHRGHYPMYSGTSMDLGNHMIDIKSHIPDEDFREIVNANKIKDKVNFSNVVDINSAQEKALRRLYKNMPDREDFNKFKSENLSRLEAKGLFRALRTIYGSANYHKWDDIDKNLFLLEPEKRDKRIKEIYKLQGEEIDFYFYKQFLAEKDLKKAKENLNTKGLKLNADFICGFSYDEVWSHPKAFTPNASIGWGLPALNFDNPEAEKLLREKAEFYAKRFDGFRVDAGWTYINQPQNSSQYKYYDDKILNIIEDEVKKVKGKNYDLKNLMYEFSADPKQFNIYSGNSLKPYIANRVQIRTSDHLSNNWGSNRAFLDRNWNPANFIIGAANHDSNRIKPNEKQAKVLSKILKIPEKKLTDEKEFIRAKLAEPAGAYNNMIFFRDALALDDTNSKIPADYKEYYENLLKNKDGYNPMDALEKTFKAKGLDKEEPELYKKIVKYRKILDSQEKQIHPIIKLGAGIVCLGILAYGIFKYTKQEKQKNYNFTSNSQHI